MANLNGSQLACAFINRFHDEGKIDPNFILNQLLNFDISERVAFLLTTMEHSFRCGRLSFVSTDIVEQWNNPYFKSLIRDKDFFDNTLGITVSILDKIKKKLAAICDPSSATNSPALPSLPNERSSQDCKSESAAPDLSPASTSSKSTSTSPSLLSSSLLPSPEDQESILKVPDLSSSPPLAESTETKSPKGESLQDTLQSCSASAADLGESPISASSSPSPSLSLPYQKSTETKKPKRKGKKRREQNHETSSDHLSPPPSIRYTCKGGAPKHERTPSPAETEKRARLRPAALSPAPSDATTTPARASPSLAAESHAAGPAGPPLQQDGSLLPIPELPPAYYDVMRRIRATRRGPPRGTRRWTWPPRGTRRWSFAPRRPHPSRPPSRSWNGARPPDRLSTIARFARAWCEALEACMP
eukprot:gnl/Trimastix_PCT/181.p1 GENE.gnl/Trimastix_PCT/181~~gnl/Trimastix_PCT/181.p1  ORF type:complete len:417 (+),score=-11.07 gnl/Trimastix_PCT/181:99-1349(+)